MIRQSMTNGCKSKTTFTETFIVRNDSKNKADVKINVIPSNNSSSKTHSLKVEPIDFCVKKVSQASIRQFQYFKCHDLVSLSPQHKEVEVTVTVEVLQGGVLLQEILSLDVEDGKRVPVIVRLRSEPAVFGVSIDRLDCEEVREA